MKVAAKTAVKAVSELEREINGGEWKMKTKKEEDEEEEVSVSGRERKEICIFYTFT